jgi:hypothetical protein
MRKSYEHQFRFEATPIAELQLNLDCRDEIIPVLAALRHVFLDDSLRTLLTELVAQDVSESRRRDTGRPGLDDWHILVLGVLRTSCNLDYDKLQDLAENHLSLRTILGVCGWDQDVSFDFRRLRNAITQVKSSTLEQINQLVVAHGQALHGSAAQTARADSFVIETNIHYPTESSLMYDGMRKLLPLAGELARDLDEPGWRQAEHQLKQIKKLHRKINQLSASKIIKKKEAMQSLYCDLIERVGRMLDRSKKLGKAAARAKPLAIRLRINQLNKWIELTEQVHNTAYRRIVLGESVPNSDKLFSVFETHTQLYQRGKAGEPIQYGRLAMIFEDGAGFISHYHVLDRDACDSSVAIEQTIVAKARHGGELQRLSLDRGFHSADNVKALSKVVAEVSCPSRNAKQYAAEVASESMESRRWRHHHAGVESVIGALQRGNGLKRCRDRTEEGLKKYLGFAVLARNLQVLGKLLIARQSPECRAATSERQMVA